MSSAIQAISGDLLTERLADNGRVSLIYFWSEWCGPCKLVSSILEEAAAAFEEHLSIYKLNVDTEKVVVAEFGVHQIPTLVLLRSGRIIDKKTGAVTRTQLKLWVEAHL